MLSAYRHRLMLRRWKKRLRDVETLEWLHENMPEAYELIARCMTLMNEQDALH